MKSISPKTYGTFDNNVNNVYGEIYCDDLILLILEAPITIYSFIDLGCGIGKQIIHVSKQLSQIEYVCGIENNHYRYYKAQLKLNKCSTTIQNKVEIIYDDFLNHSFVPYDFVYCCNTMFDNEQNEKLIKKCIRECKHVFVLFTLEPKCFHLFWRKFSVKTSWKNNVDVYMYIINKN